MNIPLLSLLIASAPLKVGDKAPDFTLPDTEGKPVKLSEILKNGPVILAFFPAAFTGGCTKEMNTYRNRFGDVEKKGATVVGISTDDVETQKKFKASLKLPFPMLADPGKKVVEQYAGTNMFGKSHRISYVIAQDGKITAVETGIDAIDPAESIAACPLRQPK